MYSNKTFIEKKYGFRVENAELAYMRGTGLIFREPSWVTRAFESFGLNPDASRIGQLLRNAYGVILGAWIARFKIAIPVIWELVVLNDGDPVILISSRQSLDPLISNERDFINFILFGTDDTGKWNFYTSSLILHTTTTHYSQDGEFLRYEGMIGKQALLYKDGFSLRNGEAVAYFRNMQIRDRLNLTFDSISCELAGYLKASAAISRIRAKTSRYGLLSCLILNPKNFTDFAFLISYIEKFGWWSSVAFGNMAFAPILRFFDGADVTAICMLNPISDSYRKSNVVPQDNLAHYYSLYDKVITDNNLSEFQKLVSLHGNSRSQDYLEMKLAALLMTYEFGISFILKFRYNVPLAQIKTIDNVQQKLKYLNSFMRFIDKSFLDDNLRENIRNPLFHTGDISDISVDKLLDIYYSYYDLLSRILLKAFGYTGKYITILGGDERDV